MLLNINDQIKLQKRRSEFGEGRQGTNFEICMSTHVQHWLVWHALHRRVEMREASLTTGRRLGNVGNGKVTIKIKSDISTPT